MEDGRSSIAERYFGDSPRWKGYQRENARYLANRRFSVEQIADLLMLPEGKIRRSLGYMPRRWRDIDNRTAD